jgi:hypothetical protein
MNKFSVLYSCFAFLRLVSLLGLIAQRTRSGAIQNLSLQGVTFLKGKINEQKFW